MKKIQMFGLVFVIFLASLATATAVIICPTCDMGSKERGSDFDFKVAVNLDPGSDVEGASLVVKVFGPMASTTCYANQLWAGTKTISQAGGTEVIYHLTAPASVTKTWAVGDDYHLVVEVRDADGLTLPLDKTKFDISAQQTSCDLTCPDTCGIGWRFEVLPGVNEVCVQVITYAQKGTECKAFQSPCNVPPGWTVVNGCQTIQCYSDADCLPTEVCENHVCTVTGVITMPWWIYPAALLMIIILISLVILFFAKGGRPTSPKRTVKKIKKKVRKTAKKAKKKQYKPKNTRSAG